MTLPVLSDFKDLRDAVARGLASLRSLALEADHQEDAQALLLEEDRLREALFRIVVIGEFSRGKSTLVNALLGRRILPARLRPTTSVVIRLRHGAQECVTLTRDDGEAARISLDQLAHVSTVTGEGSRGVREVLIEVPSPLLANGVEVVDTPGVNDLSVLREDITLAFLPSADAAIFVLDAKACFTESERRFLTRNVLAANIHRVFFVVNKIDQLDPPYSGADLDALRARVLEIVAPYIPSPRIFFVAARPALDGAMNNDSDLRAMSAIGDFMEALSRFLVEERGEVRIERALRVAFQRHQGIVEGLTFRGDLLGTQREEALKRREERASRVTEVEAVLERLHASWNLRVQEGFARIEDDVTHQAAAMQREIAAHRGSPESIDPIQRQIQQAFVGIAENAMGRLRTMIQEAARAMEGRVDPASPALSISPPARTDALTRLRGALPDEAIFTLKSTAAAAGVMGVAAIFGILAPGGILVAGLVAFLMARAAESDTEMPSREANLELQRRSGEAARRLVAILEAERTKLADSLWSEIARPIQARLDAARSALVLAQTDLERTDDERHAALDRLQALRGRLDSTLRDLMHYFA